MEVAQRYQYREKGKEMEEKRLVVYSRHGHIRAFRVETPVPEPKQRENVMYGVKGNPHLAPRGLKHKGARINGVKVK